MTISRRPTTAHSPAGSKEDCDSIKVERGVTSVASRYVTAATTANGARAGLSLVLMSCRVIEQAAQINRVPCV